ncbi:MAG: glycosyltransferase [Chloroflexota bacterium]|nr:MAG: glycosyltransferase [Chloroflexota bacterium]
MRRRKISMLTADCTIHTLPRSRILAQLLAAKYEVEVVAPVFPGDQDGYGAFPWPCRYVPVPVRKLPGFTRSVTDLLDSLTGDVIYASKPKTTSLGVALLARRRRKTPVVVDIDDREIYHCYPYSYHMSKNLLLSFKQWSHPNAYPLTLAMEKLVRRADHVTSVSSYFQKMFGGTVVPQAVDTDLFDPALYDRETLRRQWGLERYKVVLFLGRPQPHKGLEDILGAIEMSCHPETRLVVVGGHTPYLDSLRQRERVICLGPQPFDQAPAFLAMADVVMLPQRLSPLALGQMPAKLPEALAMGVPVIASAISDMPRQVGNGGMVVSPGDIAALGRALDRLLSDNELARIIGQTARRRALELYSLAAVRPVIEKVFEQTVEG